MSEPWEYWPREDESKGLVVYAIYHGLPEHPDKYVIRRWRIQGNTQRADRAPFIVESLEEARRFVPPGKMDLGACLIDPYKLVEAWM